MKKSAVALVKEFDAEQAVGKAFDLLGGAGVFLKRGSKVLVKPNLSFPVPAEESPEITNPAVIRAVVSLLRKQGAKEVFVGDQSVWGCRTRDTFRITGVDKAVEEAGGQVCCFDEEKRVEAEVPHGIVFEKISLPKVVKEADVFVNLPKLKTSFIADLTMGIKNLLGLLTFKDRQKFHRKIDLAYVLGDILKVANPDLTMIDAITIMEGFGPHAGTARDMGLIIASKDIVAADAVGAAVVGFDPLEPPATQVAARYGFGCADLEGMKVLGSKVEDVRQYVKRAVISYVSKYPNVDVYTGGICPGCAPRIPAFPPNYDSSKKYALIIGRRVRLPKRLDADEIWCCGTCGIESAKVFSHVFIEDAQVHFVPGCPPLKWYAQNTVIKTLRKKGRKVEFTAE